MEDKIKCFTCSNFSFSVICRECQKRLLKPNLYIRELSCGVKIYSFYKEEIKELIYSKYRIYGSAIYKILAQNSMKKFAENFEYQNRVYAIPIDDNPKKGFSQEAILAKTLKSKNIKPIYNALRATNQINYAGKSLNFRLRNPRNFIYNYKKNIDVILVDDIVTTGVTISEASTILEQNSVNILFALTLIDAKFNI